MKQFFLNFPFFLNLQLRIVLCLCIFSSAFVWSGSDEGSTKNLLRQTLQQLGNFEANYDQRVENKNGSLLEQGKGYFVLVEQKKFRSDVTHPYQLQTLSDGEKLWIIDHDLEQVTVGFLSDYLKDSPVALLLNNADQNNKDQIGSMLEAFSVEYVTNKEREQELFKLRSLDKQTLFNEIRLGLKQKKLSYIELDERSGNRVRLNFTQVKNLTAINDNLFKPRFPEHFELIDDTVLKPVARVSEPSSEKSSSNRTGTKAQDVADTLP